MTRHHLAPLAAALTVATLALGLALPLSAQGEGLNTEQRDFRLQMEQLDREGTTVNPLLLLDLGCIDGASPCTPVIRMFVRSAPIDSYRLPALPPLLSAVACHFEPDKRQLKEDQKNTALFTAACAELPNADLCKGQWTLKKVWKISAPSAEGTVAFNLRTKLVKPGATNPQIPGAVGPEQVLQMQVPFAQLPDRIVFPIWELNGYLNAPETYSAR